ncbi:MAG: winged helix-turn-helix domain-containing protein [Rudaea sp.]|uniref:protein kinase domain-containing protein n=1 Tax=unclassified Rudaea TaxID=2627037 RepID=UPI0010F94075|nr:MULTISPECIES: winged helix-turn-helix domain-containing protein [unclassified Rudaea]MBN8888005.1 winged helix-turn-helix domain-containing protein [Rudaea sp.]
MRWRFGTSAGAAVFDEGKWELTVGGVPTELERKPLEVLGLLLRHAGETVTKDELLDHVWRGRIVVEGALTNAIGKLRRALGDEAQTLLTTVARVGYRILGPVEGKHLPRAPLGRALRAGEAVPRRPQWRLMAALDQSEHGEVWRAQHTKTGESRVFKFSLDGYRLSALKREATLSRLLYESLGDVPAFVRVREWDFEDAPYFLEADDGGPDLETWAGARGGLESWPLAERLAWLAEVADAVGAAHELGVLHKDLKPTNLLIYGEEGHWLPRVVDFGSARLLEPERLDALGITRTGTTLDATGSLTGTPLYVAPEVLAGQSATVKSDLYALGVLLFQLVAGDLRRPLSAGWEADVSDPLLREDIGACANGNPALRLEAARTLAVRLRTLDERRQAAERDAVKRAQAEEAARRWAAARARRPWVLTAWAALIVGFVVATVLFVQARTATAAAQKEARGSGAMLGFLTKDVLGQADVDQAGTGTRSLGEAIQTAAGRIDSAFPQDPEVAARLHESIAKALASRNDANGTEQQYAQAAALYERALGPSATPTLKTRMALLARRLVDPRNDQVEFKPELDALTQAAHAAEDGGAGVFYSLNSLWTIYYSDRQHDPAAALPYSHASYERAIAEHGPQESGARMNYGVDLLRLKRYAEADRVFRDAIEQYTREKGPEHPITLDFQHRLVMSLTFQKRYREAEPVAEAVRDGRRKALGPGNTDTIDALSNLATVEGGLGKWGEQQGAIEEVLRLYQPLAEGWEPAVLTARLTRAGVWARLGRADDARKEVADVRALAHQHENDQGEYGDMIDYVAAIVALRGQHWDEAAELLGRLDPNRVRTNRAYLTGEDGVAKWSLAQAMLASGRGDRAAALTWANRAVAGFQAADSPADYVPAREAEELRAAVTETRAGERKASAM